MFFHYPVGYGAVGYDLNRTIIHIELFFADLIGGMVMKVPVHTGNGFESNGIYH